MTSTEAKKPLKRLKARTLKDVVALALEAEQLTADEHWTKDRDERQELKAVLDDLDMTILTLRRRSERSLVRRLARAEAERLRGSILQFEWQMAKLPRSRSTQRGRKEAAYASEMFNSAVSAFIVLARGL